MKIGRRYELEISLYLLIEDVLARLKHTLHSHRDFIIVDNILHFCCYIIHCYLDIALSLFSWVDNFFSLYRV